jgi:hypothetical protein
MEIAQKTMAAMIARKIRNEVTVPLLVVVM